MKLQAPNRVLQIGIYRTGSPNYIDLADSTAAGGYRSFSEAATADDWQAGDYVGVLISVGATLHLVGLAEWSPTLEQLLLRSTDLIIGGALTDGDTVQIAACQTTKTLHVPPTVFSADVYGLQGALDKARTSGGGLVSVAGEWEITTALLIGSNTHLRLEPGARIVRAAAIDNMLRNYTSGVTGYDNDAGITVEGGVWDGNSSVYGSNCCLIAFGHATNIRVTNATLTNIPGWHGLELNGVRNALIDHCAFSELPAVDKELLQIDLMKSSTQYPWETEFDDLPCENIVVSDCTFESASRGVGTHSATTGVVHRNICIKDCRFYGMTQQAIYGYNWQDVLIRGNVVDEADAGIVLTVAESTSVTGFVIADNILSNIDATDSSRGIHILGISGGPSVSVGRISNNVLTNIGRHGIGADYSGSVVIDGNIVDTLPRVGIWVFSSSNCVVRDNHIRNVGTYYSPKRAVCVGNTASPASGTKQNIVTGNYGEAVDLLFADRTIVSNNVVGRITVSGDATNSQVSANYIGDTWTA